MVKKTDKPTTGPNSQLEKFKDAARLTGTDDSEEAFDRIVKRVAKAPPARQPEQTGKRRKP